MHSTAFLLIKDTTKNIKLNNRFAERMNISRWGNEPGVRETLLMTLSSFVIFILFVSVFDDYFNQVQVRGDNYQFVLVVEAIRNWDFNYVDHSTAAVFDIRIRRVFFGFPLAIFGVSAIPLINDFTALVIASMLSSLVSVFLCHRLWGGWVACLFAILNWDWIQRSVVGGNEPMFMALLLGGFYFYRKKNIPIAIVLSALSVTVRPMGVFALLAIGFHLILKKEYRNLAVSVLIGGAIGLSYASLVYFAYGDFLANLVGYRDYDNGHNPALKMPFVSLYEGFLESKTPMLNQIKIFSWIGLTIVGVFAILKNQVINVSQRSYPAEYFFLVLYLGFIITYSSPSWFWEIYPRYIIPILPILYFAFIPWIYKNKLVIWSISVVSSILAGASSISVYVLWERIQQSYWSFSGS